MSTIPIIILVVTIFLSLGAWEDRRNKKINLLTSELREIKELLKSQNKTQGISFYNPMTRCQERYVYAPGGTTWKGGGFHIPPDFLPNGLSEEEILDVFIKDAEYSKKDDEK